MPLNPEHMVGAQVLRQNGGGKFVRISFTMDEFPRADRSTDLYDTFEEALEAPYVLDLDDDMQVQSSPDWELCKNVLREGVRGDREAIKEKL